MTLHYRCQQKNRTDKGFALMVFVIISGAILAFLATARAEQDIMLQNYLTADQTHYQKNLDTDSASKLLELSELESG